ncbi:MAG: hypothetical protein FJW69_03405 [Actinobacteria bacterium]|nr:hypothetical protein [Actinomycetota bacterium]MBM3713341.1 hypothetical protein [Actinomycetota bacterium]
MTVYHKNIRQKFQDMNFFEQMANVGSEIYRAIGWREKGNPEYAIISFERALELLDFTSEAVKEYHRLKELRRLREVIVDYFAGDNSYKSSPELWNNYFFAFNYAAALLRQKR